MPIPPSPRPTAAWGLALAGLAFLAGCGRPRVDPWPGRLAAAVQTRAAALSPSERRDYEAGFANGAGMVENALKQGVRPYRPVMGGEPPALEGAGPLPPGSIAGPDRLHREVDPATGLMVFPAAGAAGGAFARGQVEGFDWALEAIGRSLLRPVPDPPLPSRWVPWPSQGGSLSLQVGPRDVQLRWRPGLLAWSWKERGFPSQRNWRAWEGEPAPGWAGASAQALWIETGDHRAIALDLATGGILAIRPAPPHEAPANGELEAYEASVAKELASPAFQQDLARLRSAAASGAIPDLLAVARKLGGMGEAADREAFRWYLKAAEKGSPEAMLRVGVTLFHGGPIEADREGARRWLDRAIEAGHPMAAAVKATLFGAETPASAAPGT